jgi:hypothetical protein
MLSSFGRSRLAGIPLVLAVLTKQTYVTAIISVAIQLWPRRRAMLLFLAPVVACVLLVLVVGQVLSGGWLLWHTVIADANPLNIDYFSAMFTEFIQLNAVPVIAAAALLAIPSLPGERQWRTYFVLSGLQALLTVGKLGASSNYWLELTAATAALIGIGAVRLTRDVTIRRGFTSATLAGVVLAGLLTVVPGYAATVTATAQLALMDKPPAQLAIAADVAREPGDVLTDDPSLALLAGKPVEFEFIIFTILAAGHIWDERPILDAIASHRFSLVILSQPLEEPAQPLISARWSPAVHDAILANYAAAGQDGAYWLYRERA